MADEADENDNKICKVYDKDDFFTVVVQLLLAVLALASLYLKRMREVPRRKFRIWSLDVTKQGLGACYAHVLNMIIAAIISQNLRGEAILEDQCAWYGMSYLIDTTLGLFLAIVLLRILDYAANERDWISLKNSGVYSGPDGLLHWIHQVFAWLAILTVVKVIIYFFMWATSQPLAFFGGILFAPLQENIHFELLFVMIFFPGLLNVIYFWIADSYLKAKKDQADAHEPEEMADKKENLLSEGEKLEQQSQPPAWSDLNQDPAKPRSAVV